MIKWATTKLFKLAASAALVAMPAAVCAADEEAPNAAATELPSAPSVTPASAVALQVQVLDARTYTEESASLAAATASQNRVTIVIWGGNLTLQQQAFAAANDLVSAGIPAAFVVGPDHNSLSDDAVFQVYVGGKPFSDGRSGSDNADQVRGMLRSRALEAHRETFAPQLTLR